MRKNLIWVLTLPCLLATSCNIEDLGKIKPGTVSPHIAINLGYSEYTVQELLEDLEDESVEITTNADQTIALYFSESTVYDGNDDLIAINSVSNEEEFAPAENVPATPIGYEIEIDEVFTFSFPANNGEEIDSLIYSAGTLDFEMLSTFKGDIDYTWTIEGTKLVTTNVDLTNSEELVYTGADVTDSYSRPLEGLKSKFYKNAFDENEFQVHVVGTITFEAGTEILPEQRMTFDLAFNNPGFTHIYGKFGSDPIDLQNQSIDMTAFNDFSGDGLKLEDPRVYLITTNSYGMDIELSFDELKAVDADGNEVLLQEITPPGIDGFVSSPEIEGEVKIDTIELNNQNSNIDDLLNSAPVLMEFEISGIPNPASSSRLNNFLLEDSRVEIESLIAIPMQFQMDGFSVDFDFELNDLDIESAESIIFNIIATNEIPFSGAIDLSFIDDQGNLLFSLPNAANIESPTVGSDGKTTAPHVSNSGIDLSSEGIDALINAHKILATANISTFEHEKNRYVTLYSDYKLNIELSLAGEVTIQL
ncbi:MAG: hypothetical protein ABJO02_06280 [Reichenbachiella sp.]|uniref:hypothetical protein n=1 Tax=Reichenbachiella sp. TaxID=2184521 RepID=UPI003299DF00